MKRFITGLAIMGVLLPGLAAASDRPQSSIRSESSSTSWTAHFPRFSISSRQSESLVSYRKGTYSGSLLPKKDEPVEVAPNHCGPAAFQVVNPGRSEGLCVGRSAR